MANYRSVYPAKKLLLTMASETAYVVGGQSAFGGIWGGYLPIIDALRDSLDLLQMQLYNSGTMFGINGNTYTQGTADFIVAMSESLIAGFNTSGGLFAGLPASKIAVGLPACSLAAGGGYIVPAATKHCQHQQRGKRYIDNMGFCFRSSAISYSLSSGGHNRVVFTYCSKSFGNYGPN
jgi:chitinase